METLVIYGAGGFGKETLCAYRDAMRPYGASSFQAFFMVDDEHFSESRVLDTPVIRRTKFDPVGCLVVVAVGDPRRRADMVANLPAGTRFGSVVHPSAVISDSVEVGEGAIITAGCVLTCDIKIGKHAHLNLNSTVGHDCVIGDYFTTAPAANVSGKCQIGDRVYIGTGAGVREGIRIESDVTIGMGAAVVHSLVEPGIYTGIPARLKPVN